MWICVLVFASQNIFIELQAMWIITLVFKIASKMVHITIKW